MKDRRRLLAVLVVSFLLPAAVWAALGWYQATPAAPWAPRSLTALVAFHDTMWLMGGITYVPDTMQFNDVWKSADGVSWAPVESAAAWSPRDGHAVAELKDTMWLTGGEILDRTKRDVWCSANGAGWTRAVDSTPWQDRGGHTLVRFRDTLWLAGGLRWTGGPIYEPLSDVWKSGDGRTWLLADSSAPWGARGGHTSVVFNDTLWVMGGYDWRGQHYNDVWKSGDGDSWTRVTDTAPWGPKYVHGSVVAGGRVWVMGGWRLFPQRTNDVWWSTDGVTWNQDNDSAAWPKRGHVTAVAYHERVWVMAGDTSAGRYTGSNDVWYSDSILGIEEAPTAEVRRASIGATILSGVSAIRCLASCDIFDAMGRRAVNPKPGVYLVRKQPQATSHKLQAVSKVVVTR